MPTRKMQSVEQTTTDGNGFRVQRRLCATCIYKPDSTLDLEALEEACKDRYGFFKNHRTCHHSSGKQSCCCRGFWNAHKDEFLAGQLAQRLDRVVFVDIDNLKGEQS